MGQVLLDKKKSRFSDAVWAKEPKNYDIVIGGAGGIGSWLAFYLASIGYNLHIYDFDVVEEHNLGGQLYSIKDCGKHKVDALNNTILEFRGESINTYNEKFTEDSLVSPIMISAFDNMEARKVMFEKWKSQEDRTAFIDGRMLAELGMYYCVTSETEHLYEHELFDDSEVEQENCSYKSTTHCGGYIASQMTALVTNIIYNQVTGIPIRATPLKTEFDFAMMNFEVVDESEIITEVL